MAATRKRWTIAILLLAAGASFWAVRWLGRDGRAPSPLPEARSDYALHTFALVVMNSGGLPSFRLEAPYLEKSPEDESLTVEEPRLWLFEEGRMRWRARAAQGWIRGDGEEIRLTGAVQVNEEAEEGLALQTTELTLFPDSRLASSSAPVELRQRDMRMHGLGLDADLNARRFELLSQVRGQYDPN